MVVCVPAAGEVVSWTLEISAAGTCRVTAGYVSRTMTLRATALSAGHPCVNAALSTDAMSFGEDAA